MSQQPVQVVEVTISGPATYERTLAQAFQTGGPVPRQVFSTSIHLPYYPPEFLREKVLSFLVDLDTDDQHYLSLERDQVGTEAAEAAVERAMSILEQQGWHEPHPEPPVPHWAQDILRTEEQRDPTRHDFEPLTTPGLLNRCAWCGRAARSHFDQPEEAATQEPLPEAAELPEEEP